MNIQGPKANRDAASAADLGPSSRVSTSPICDALVIHKHIGKIEEQIKEMDLFVDVTNNEAFQELRKAVARFRASVSVPEGPSGSNNTTMKALASLNDTNRVARVVLNDAELVAAFDILGRSAPLADAEKGDLLKQWTVEFPDGAPGYLRLLNGLDLPVSDPDFGEFDSPCFQVGIEDGDVEWKSGPIRLIGEHTLKADDGGTYTLQVLTEALAAQHDAMREQAAVAEWVGLHYGRNYEKEPPEKQEEWRQRYIEMHSEE